MGLELDFSVFCFPSHSETPQEKMAQAVLTAANQQNLYSERNLSANYPVLEVSGFLAGSAGLVSASGFFLPGLEGASTMVITLPSMTGDASTNATSASSADISLKSSNASSG